MQTTPDTFDQAPDSPTPNSNTPQYGEFGKQTTAEAHQHAQNEHSVTEGGAVAPPTAFPEQRGSTPQNLDPSAVREVEDSEYFEQREGWAADDPRYAGGTRNWATNEPANQTTEPAPEGDEHPKNPNVGKNDNPDEFSAFRPDEGRGIPGSGK
ncbi:hypothetical protein [Hymenobacter sp. 102]|uniref:hypothetical protein n=1 Tax=Hymenobacter sp. 102 TaxID=3403152 RepID=UPI003CE931AC